jgi:hypothetical protein
MENWFEPKAANMGQIGGISVNQKADTIVVFHRGTQTWQTE